MKYSRIVTKLSAYTHEPLARDFIEKHPELFTQSEMDTFEDTRKAVANIIGETEFAVHQSFSNKDMQYLMNLLQRDQKKVAEYKARAGHHPNVKEQLQKDLIHIDEVKDKLLATLPHI